MSTDTIATYTKGEIVHLVADLTNAVGGPGDASGFRWLVRDPVGVMTDKTSDVTQPVAGEFALDIEADTVGIWYWKLTTAGVVAVAEGTFGVEDNFDVISDPTAPTDLRVLVPRARRYCEGPFPDVTRRLTDQQLYEMVADALADIILLTANDFTCNIVVTSRDPRVGYPIRWATDKVLTEWEAAIVTTQAALNFFFHEFKDKKVSENMANEGQTWEWALSPLVVKQQFDMLKDTRDRALSALAQITPTLARFASVIAVRDRVTATQLEWWARANPGQIGSIGGIGGGQEASSIPVFYPPGP